MAVRFVNARRLRHKVDILRVEETIDDLGDSVQTTYVDATVHAEVMPMTFRDTERLAREGQNVESITHRVVIRHREGITTKHKLRFGSRILEIAGVANVGERDVMMEILGSEVING